MKAMTVLIILVALGALAWIYYETLKKDVGILDIWQEWLEAPFWVKFKPQ